MIKTHFRHGLSFEISDVNIKDPYRRSQIAELSMGAEDLEKQVNNMIQNKC